MKESMAAPLPRHLRRLALDASAALLAPALATLAGRAAGANETTAALLELLAVLFVAAGRGFAAGAAASLAATLAYNFFFLPPVHTFSIADGRNWVALAAFLVASVVAGRLLATARERATEALAGRRDAETLSDLALQLFAFNARPGDFEAMTSCVVRALGARGGALDLGTPDGQDRQVVALASPPGVDARAESEAIPLELGGEHLGRLTLHGATASQRVRQAAARLLALALERHRLIAETARTEAARESERLQSALLRAVSHDLKSPLTALRIGLEALGERADLPAAAAARIAALARDQERLARRVDNLLALARLEAGRVRPRPEPTPPGDLFGAARADLAHLLEGRVVEVRVGAECPDLWVDPVLASEVLVNLLENAARHAPPGPPIELAARAVGARVELTVADRGPGPGAPASESSADGHRAGLGLRIARELARASGGEVALEARPGGGALARFSLPAATAVETVP